MIIRPPPSPELDLELPLDELAMRYLLLVNSPPYPGSSIDCWNILEAMRARCGLGETNTHLKRARQIYRMIIPKQEK